ncbi:phage virion morphogenesis protein [Gluconacetobacter entanii]|uniref:phage virion morphogenesis protein n=1 Tax=Gluconacetobacter entanii TaxID=108528 RepID=UPI001C93200F|nr:phage virion morphogenesis protein [Gluconacetobacter entanii]MBY4640295.1 phage virion morphogenesis protein [Gluconacetobacter entanii]MCW4579931.1 phage virion morphogenesis protein [Gluconacetobacter entanii]MCW4584644.1 phage virion morphogenesis protein [Gluconacetobacter entanii]MCW4588094.1 phage virion morphogenesis protein [Gluconacetobacter entanii]
MAFISVSGDTGPIQSALDAIAAIGTRPQAVLESIGLELHDRTVERMERGVDPRGIQWATYAPLNPLYQEDKESTHILIERGDLRDSIHSEVAGNALLVGTDLIYGAIHQFGGVIRPKDASSLTFEMGGEIFHRGSVTIPARPYLGLGVGDEAAIIDRLDEFLALAMRGR